MLHDAVVIGAGPAGSSVARLLAEEKVVAYRFDGRRYDCGRKLGYLEATVDFGLKHPEVADEFASFLRTRLQQRT